MCSNNAKNSAMINNVPFKLEQTARVCELLGRSYYKKYVKKKSILEQDEFFILCCIKQNPTISQSNISKMLFKGKAHIGKILSNMEKKGYITRTVSMNKNVMVKHSILTDKGEKLYEETDKAFIELAKHTLKVFTEEEIQTFVGLLDKYKTSMLEKFEILF